MAIAGWIPKDWRWLALWALAFVAGLLLIVYAPGAWPALGMLIVAPTVITLGLFGWGFALALLVKIFGGAPSDTFGVWVFISFAFLVLPMVVAWLGHHR